MKDCGIATSILACGNPKIISVDTETNGLRPWHGDRPFAFSACDPEERNFFSRFKVDPFTRAVNFKSAKKEFDAWAGMLENSKIEKVFHNHKFDVRMFEMSGIKVRGQIHDTMFAMHVLRTAEPTLALKPLCKKYLGISDSDEKDLQSSTVRGRREGKKKGWLIATEETHGKKPVNADYWLAEPKLLEKYARIDAYRTMLLWLLLEERLKAEGLWQVYLDEMALAPVTYRMETRGIRINPATVARERIKNRREFEKLGAKIQRVKPGLNVDSPKQLSNYLYKELGVKCTHFTDAGNPSVSSDALQSMEAKIPIVKTIQLFKASEKANTNFFDKYHWAMVEESPGIWILHPDFNQIGPVTGRYSCRNPNIQNVANALTTRSSVPIQARTPFSPRDGYYWYHFDFSQIEMWIFAALAGEDKMLDALFNGRDLHGETADWIWGKGIVAREAAVGKKTARAKAKMMNFGIIYGIGPTSLSELTKTSYKQACEDLDKYKAAFPKIATFMDRTIRRASEVGYVEGPMGRRWQVYHDRAYVAVNYLVQGSAAQVLKSTMLRVDNFIQSSGIDGHLIATIHDEHVDEIKIGHDNPTVLRKIKRISEDHGTPFGLPKLPIDIDVTRKTWNKKVKYKEEA